MEKVRTTEEIPGQWVERLLALQPERLRSSRVDGWNDSAGFRP